MSSKPTAFDESTWQPHVWVFNGPQNPLSSGVFTSKAIAEEWIASNRVTGMLTAYPLDTGIHQWSIDNGYFTPKSPEDESPVKIQSFSSAYLPHFHYENGIEESGGIGGGL